MNGKDVLVKSLMLIGQEVPLPPYYSKHMVRQIVLSPLGTSSGTSRDTRPLLFLLLGFALGIASLEVSTGI